MSPQHFSNAETYTKRSNRLLLIVGICLFLIFMLALCTLSDDKKQETQDTSTYFPPSETLPIPGISSSELPSINPGGNASLQATPSEVELAQVQLNSTAEAIISVSAVNAKIQINSWNLASAQSGGFSINSDCSTASALEIGESCIFTISWNPTTVRQIENILFINWKEDNPAVFRENKLAVPLKASSTDKSNCVVCDTTIEKPAPQYVYGPTGDIIGQVGDQKKFINESPKIGNGGEFVVKGEKYKVDKKGNVLDKDGNIVGNVGKNGKVTINGVEYQIADGGSLIDKNGRVVGQILDQGDISFEGRKYQPDDFGFLKGENGEILGIVMPQKIPLSLDGTLLGRLNTKDEVVSAEGDTIGKALEDGTIVNENLNVIGGCVYLASVIDENGTMIGELKQSGVVVDKSNFTLGKALPDGTVLDKDDKIVGYIRPSGLVMDFNGKIIGTINFDGAVINVKGETLGKVLPNGLVLSNEELPTLIGAVVPTGVAIQPGCNSGQLLLNGQVRDSFEQIIGTTDIEGRIFTSDHKLIGQVVRAGLIIDEQKKIIGYINKDGKAIDKRGSVIGCVNPDGSVVAGKKIIGTLMPKGILTDTSCQFLGTVMPNGKIQKGSEKTSLTIGADGWAGSNNTLVGAVIPARTAFSEDCGLLGFVSPTGHVKTPGGAVLGCISAQGDVLNEKKEAIGRIFAPSSVLDANSQLVGYTQSNGMVVSAAGTKLGCVNSNGIFQSIEKGKIGWAVFSSAAQQGVISNASGQTTGWSILGNQVYDVVGNLLGNVVLNRWVTDLSGNLIGQIHPNGTVIDPDGKFLARYISMLGKSATNDVVLPDKTVLNETKTQIKGSLIADDACFSDNEGTFLGCVSPNEMNREQKTLGTILPNGILQKEGKEIGYLIPTGLILAPYGQTLGYATPKGIAFSLDQKRIGTVLGNGLVMGASKTISGKVLSDPTIVLQGDSFVGTVAPNGLVRSNNGRQLGWASAFKYAFNPDGNVVGTLLSLHPFLDASGNLTGWLSYQGKRIGAQESLSERVYDNGISLNDSAEMTGAIRKYGPVISESGMPIGFVNVTGKPANAISFADGSHFYYADQNLAGHLSDLFIGIDNNGKAFGFSQPNGFISTTKLLPDRTLVHKDTNLILGYAAPLGELVLSPTNEPLGIVNTTGAVINKDGQEIGTLVAGGFAIKEDQVFGKLSENDAFVPQITSGNLLGFANATGSVNALSDASKIGSSSPSLVWGFVNNLIGKVLSSQSSFDFALKPLGRFLLTGQIAGTSNKATATGVLFNDKGKIEGFTASPISFADGKGQYLGTLSGTKNTGATQAIRLPLGAILSPSNTWVGGALQKGLAVSDTGKPIGFVHSNGTILKDNQLVARQTGTGFVLANTNLNEYAFLPAIGQVPPSGLAISLFQNTLLGKQTLTGSVAGEDALSYKITDDGLLRDKTGDPAGRIVPILPAIDTAGNLLGMPFGSGKVVDFSGKEQGTLASNGAVKRGSFFNIIGGIIPKGIVVQSCQVVGQPDYMGKILDVSGTVKGRIDFDGTYEGGYIAPSGNVISEKGDIIGFARPDGTVIDATGAPIGCAKANGLVQSPSGTTLGEVVKRGVVFSKGNLLGFVGINGQVFDKTDSVLGRMKADASDVITNDTEDIGFIIPSRREIVLNSDNTLAGSLDLNGVFYDNLNQPVLQKRIDQTIIELKTNQPVARLDERGNLLDLSGNPLPQLVVLLDNDGFATGLISGCQMISIQGQPAGSIQQDGTIIDSNQNVFAVIGSNGILLDQKRIQIGRIVGENTLLETCVRRTEESTTPKARRIQFRNETLFITENGSIVDKFGTIRGYMGDDDLPYTLDNQLMVPGNTDPTGRPYPKTNKKMEITPEQIEQMQQLLVERRAAMRMGGIIKPDAKLLARKNYKDKNWGLGKNISTWPVDMSRVILRNKAIPAVLVHSVDSRFLDVPVTAIVERHIYSEKGRNILIPAGSTLIGTVTGSPGTSHVAKLQISWTRLIRPDGSAFSFEATSGDAQGRGGVAAYLDEQTLKKYSQPILTAAITSGINYLMTANGGTVTTTTDSEGNTISKSTTRTDKQEAAQDARDNLNDAMQQVFEQMIADSTAAPAVVFAPSGTRLTVFPNQDLWLRSITDDEEELEQTQEVVNAPRNIGNTQSSIYTPNDQYSSQPSETNQYEEQPIVETVASSSIPSDTDNEDSVIYDGSEQNNGQPNKLEERMTNPVLPRPTSAEIY